ncbi:MAG: iron ABC transporter permease, partial [Pseudomonadota bacterium]
VSDPAEFVWFALAGALIAMVMVLSLGGGNAANPTRLVLAGAAVSALFVAVTRALLLLNQQTLDTYRYWVLGGFDGLTFGTMATLLPFFFAGALLAGIGALSLNALALGTDVARSLGLRVTLAQLIVIAAVVVLSAATVAMAGPIAFVGLVVPHLARGLAGVDMRWTAAFAVPIGAGLMVVADLLGRLALFGGNLQAGVMAAMLGGPALIFLARRADRARR